MPKQSEIVASFLVLPSDIHADHRWLIEDESVVGGGSGVRITYQEPGRELMENDFIDIVASPSDLRAIARAIMLKADEQEAGNGSAGGSDV